MKARHRNLRIISSLFLAGVGLAVAALSISGSNPPAINSDKTPSVALTSNLKVASVPPNLANQALSQNTSTGECQLARSAADDAPNTAPAGDGNNVDNLDLTAVGVQPDGNGLFDAVLQVKNLSQTLPANATQLTWYFQWTSDYQLSPSYYYAGAAFPSADPTAAPGTVDFTVGTYNPSTGSYSSVASTTGTFNPGPNGTITIVIPPNVLPGVSTGSLITQTYATSWIATGAAGQTKVYLIDASPKETNAVGANYTAGLACSGTRVSGTWVPLAAGPPYPRESVAMAYDESTATVVMFGGSTSSQTWLWDGAQWSQMNSIDRPVSRAGPSMAYDPRSQTVIMFGGEATEGADRGNMLNETWAWNGKTRQWTQLHPAHSPESRKWAGMSYDPATSQMVLFSGNTIGVPTMADTWTWDGTDWTQQLTGSGPPPRFGPGMAYDGARKELVMFGGWFNLNDTWVWNGTIWQPRMPTTSPSGRDGAAMTFDADSGKIILFSGRTSPADTWAWDGTNWQQRTPGHSPPQRGYAGSTYDAARRLMVIFGGDSVGNTPGTLILGDQWAWNGSDWQQVEFEAPDARFSPGFTYDPVHDEYILFGGVTISLDYQTTTYTNETWTLQGGTWTKKYPTNSPPPQSLPQLTYDPELGKVVTVSACSSCGSDGLTATWTWDGTNWTKLETNAAPSSRVGHAIAWDPATSSLILFGGFASCDTCPPEALNDTWMFKGGTWSQLQPANSPPGRGAGAFSWSAELARLLLFSGRGVAGSQTRDPHYPDSWAWDGADWTELTSPSSPVQRELVSGVTDTSTGLMLVFGGTYTSELDDTWAWQDNAWTRVEGAPVPQARYGFGLAANSSFSGPLLFGGEHNQEYRNDLWTFISGIAPTLVVSRKIHGSAGTFDIPLFLAGRRSIENRSGGPNGNYTIVFTFPSALTSVGGATVSSGIGSVSQGAIGSDPHEYIVDLTGVANAQYLTVTLNNVTDSAGNSAATVPITMGILLGDVNASGRVDAADVSAVRQQTLQIVTSSNFRADINTSGRIDAADVSLARQQTLTSLP